MIYLILFFVFLFFIFSRCHDHKKPIILDHETLSQKNFKYDSTIFHICFCFHQGEIYLLKLGNEYAKSYMKILEQITKSNITVYYQLQVLYMFTIIFPLMYIFFSYMYHISSFLFNVVKEDLYQKRDNRKIIFYLVFREKANKINHYTMASSDMKYPVYVRFADGSCVQRTAPGNVTFGKLREILRTCRPEGFEGEKTAPRFRLTWVPAYFEDSQTIPVLEEQYKTNSEELVRVYHVFESLGTGPKRYSILLESSEDYGDKRSRQVKWRAKCQKNNLFSCNVLIQKSQSFGMAGWMIIRKLVCCLTISISAILYIKDKHYIGTKMRQTFRFFLRFLFLFFYIFFALLQDFIIQKPTPKKGKQAEKYLPMGGVMAKTDHEIIRNVGKDNLIVLEVPAHVDRAKGIYVFQAKDAKSLLEFVDKINQHIWHIKIAAIFNLLPHMTEDMATEGIFREGGERTRVEELQHEIELGLLLNFHKQSKTIVFFTLYWRMPNFGSLKSNDVHTKTTLLKRCLRSIDPPLIPLEFYGQFIRIGQYNDKSQQIQQLKPLVRKLPLKNLFIMTRLVRFLHFVTYPHFFSPLFHLLTTKKKNVHKKRQNKTKIEYMKTVMATMISNTEDILPNDRELIEQDRAVNPSTYDFIGKMDQMKPMERSRGEAFAIAPNVTSRAESPHGKVAVLAAFDQCQHKISEIPPPPVSSNFQKRISVPRIDLPRSVQSQVHFFFYTKFSLIIKTFLSLLFLYVLYAYTYIRLLHFFCYFHF
ncbi:hypothetical protein RFI_02970 [Reticulomyxa filosa]|uniref:Rho-GAP domain-containing protein n=1 Tax=Reticulomyxa filosa TaxID=46433 RepID=X6P7E6_RETFI|nr:hypothetical protein RFI_02970 [Reticulomyxa filosa]|eukprot:ETO34126.1 hypothetical protein RFI_02970 [Reticulomyxa filosa]